jgi:hypothetical protein
MLQSLRSLATSGRKIMNALVAAHDAAVQMIDTLSARISTVPALRGTKHSRSAGQEAG